MAETQPAPRRSLGLLIEQWSPLVAGIVALAFLSYYSDYISSMFASNEWKASNLYAAIFDWSAIQTGFAFGVYGFVAGKRDGFVGALQGTVAMKRFISYIRRANVAGFILTFASIPLIVLSPSLSTPTTVWFAIVVAWFSVFVWAFCSFLRLAYNFGQIVSVRDRDFHGG